MARILTAALLLLLVPASGRAQDEQWQVGSTPSFTSGTYGTGVRTDVFYTPFTARRLFADGDLTLVFPIMCLRGPGAVTIVDGTPMPIDTSRTGATSSGTTTRTGTTTSDPTTRTGAASATTTAAVPDTPTPPGTTCGAGDIGVRGRYYVLDEQAWWPTIAIRAHLKVPTAAPGKGLGTGRPDEGVGVEVSRMVGGGFTTMIDAGYTIIGKPTGVEYQNGWWYDVGVGQDLADGAVNLSVFFEEYSTIVPGLANARDILAAVTVKGALWRLQVSGGFGLSDGAPDHGFMLGASRRF
jgi:hypothetical protein